MTQAPLPPESEARKLAEARYAHMRELAISALQALAGDLVSHRQAITDWQYAEGLRAAYPGIPAGDLEAAGVLFGCERAAEALLRAAAERSPELAKSALGERFAQRLLD